MSFSCGPIWVRRHCARSRRGSLSTGCRYERSHDHPAFGCLAGIGAPSARPRTARPRRQVGPFARSDSAVRPAISHTSCTRRREVPILRDFSRIFAALDEREAGGGAIDDVVDRAGQETLHRGRAAVERNVLHVETGLAVEQIAGEARRDDPGAVVELAGTGLARAINSLTVFGPSSART